MADLVRQVNPLCGAQEEFLSAYGEQVAVAARQEAIQLELEACGEDMEKMAALLDELQARYHPVNHRLRKFSAYIMSVSYKAVKECIAFYLECSPF